MLLATLVATVLTSALAVQVTLNSDDQRRVEPPGQGNIAEWNFDELPNPNATDHLVFETVSSLLQHWPNTRMRNGHTIVPGTIPKGTVLYRGSGRKEIPNSPDWVSTDPEHAYFFCRDTFFESWSPGCWHLTLMTTRPLKVVYFDGSSAAKLPYGSLDTQDFVAWGKLGEDLLSVPEEMKRIEDLCEWGKNFGVDGFVRMEMDFEVVLCDFTSGVRVISFANLVNLWTPLPLEAHPFAEFETFHSGTWHDHFPGDTRVQLDLAGLVSFYDTELAPSLVPIRFGQERWDHRAGNISSKDFLAVKSRLEEALVRPAGLSSGIDWRTLFQVIVDRYAHRLELTRYLLNSSAITPNDMIDLANKTQTQLRIMLTPYVFLSATPADPLDKTNLSWATPIYQLCATVHTEFTASELDSMTDAERLLLRAARVTSQEICRVVTQMWAAGVYAGIDPVLDTKKTLDVSELTRLWNTWAKDLNRLMTWLDWNVWIKCHPGCAPEEMCYLPTWPGAGFPLYWVFPDYPDGNSSFHTGQDMQRRTRFEWRAIAMQRLSKNQNKMWNTVEPGPGEWIRPQPKCVRRVDPYEF